MNFTPEEIWNEIGQLHMENAKQKLLIAQYEAYIKAQQAPPAAVATADPTPTAPAADVVPDPVKE